MALIVKTLMVAIVSGARCNNFMNISLKVKGLNDLYFLVGIRVKVLLNM